MEMLSNLGELAETNLINLTLKAVELTTGSFVSVNYCSWTKHSFPDFRNKIFNLKIPEEKVDFTLAKIVEAIKIGLAPKIVLLGPTSSPKNLVKHLLANNFQLRYQQVAMAIDLAKTHFEHNSLNNQIRCIDNEKELEQWLQPASIAFNTTRSSELFQRFFAEKDLFFYGLYDHDKLVTSTLLYVKDFIAGIYFVGTLPEYRDRGFGTMIMQRVLLEALEMGCNLAVLQASAMGVSIYKKLGFSSYGDITHWELKV